MKDDDGNYEEDHEEICQTVETVGQIFSSSSHLHR